MRVYLTELSVFPVFEGEDDIRAIFANQGVHRGEPYGILGFLDPERLYAGVIGNGFEFRRRSDHSKVRSDELRCVLDQEPSPGESIVAMLMQGGEFVRMGRANLMVSGPITGIMDIEFRKPYS